MDPTSTSIDPTSTLHRPQIDPTSTVHRPHIDPTSTLYLPHIDPKWTFKKVIETQKELIDTEGFDWLESTELAIDKRKFLLNRLYQKQPIPQDED